ncbi:SapC family protein [Sulfuricurvum sp.]|uniref:SapC family protein n=1 Tax=Sulfuricurvum sp. TaxID=2025608 RepID=UPI002D5555FF|nr:SapC family protein [Sulfuricurvum sp.]HZF70820.1 SapC family protein [Sulfuricurvum sp.]
MYKNIELINTHTHKDTAIKGYTSFAYAKEMITAPVTVAEFYECCKDYPIIFVKDAEGNWTASVMLGYKEKENAFVDKEGMWEAGRYVPASIRRHPFIFVTQDNNQLSLGIDSDAKSDDKEDDNRKLFDAEGKPSEFLTNVVNFMNQFQADAASTAKFIKQLDQWELLEEKTAKIITPDQTSYQINGFYIVNEEKLNHLSKKKKQDICDQNAFPLITAHLISLSNVQRMGIK